MGRTGNEWGGLALLAGGAILVASSAGGWVVGFLIDHIWHTTPWGQVIGLLAGTAVGFWDLFLLASRLMRAQPVPEKKISDENAETAGDREENHE